MDKIKNKAFEWSIDYKPWEEDLHYREYARHGFEIGYNQALKDSVQTLQQQVSEAVDKYGVSSVLEELIVKLRRDSAAGREEYPLDAAMRVGAS